MVIKTLIWVTYQKWQVRGEGKTKWGRKCCLCCLYRQYSVSWRGATGTSQRTQKLCRGFVQTNRNDGKAIILSHLLLATRMASNHVDFAYYTTIFCLHSLVYSIQIKQGINSGIWWVYCWRKEKARTNINCRNQIWVYETVFRDRKMLYTMALWAKLSDMAVYSGSHGLEPLVSGGDTFPTYALVLAGYKGKHWGN